MHIARLVESTMFCAYLLSIIVAACVGRQIDVTDKTDCGSNAVIHSFVLEPCDSDPCVIHKGQTYTGTFNFTSSIYSVSATNNATAVAAGVNFPSFVVTPRDACGNGMTCPVQKGYTQIYTAKVTCPTVVLNVRLAAKWEVKGDNDKDILCVVFGVRIAD